MKKADEIAFKLQSHVRGSDNEIVLPNYYVGRWEFDLFRLLSSGYLYEYEIKISRADFRNDFKKTTSDRVFNRETRRAEIVNERNKHDLILSGDYPANRFYFVVPEGLVKPEEVPEKYGLIYYNERFESFREIRSAKMLHKNKNAVSLEDLCRALCWRENRLRLKVRFLSETLKLKR